MRKLLLTVLFTSVTIAPLHARNWTDKTGKYTIQAELVEVTDDAVQLRRQDGTVIKVPLSRLSTRDAKFARASRRPVAKPAQAPQLVIDSIEIPKGPHTLEWKASRRKDLIKVELQIIGKPAAKALAYGEIIIDDIAADGVALKRRVSERSQLMGPKESVAYDYIRRDKPHPFFVRSPDDRCVVWLNFEGNPNATKIDSLSGTIQLIDAEKIDWVQADLYGTREIKDPKLGGIKAQVANLGIAASVVFPGPPEYSFARIVNADGTPFKTKGFGQHFLEKEINFSFTSHGRFPKDVKVQVSCQKPPTIDVPFLIENLEIE